MSSLRDLPSVDLLAQSPQAQEWIAVYGRPLTIEAVRSVLSQARSQFTRDSSAAPSLPDRQALLAATLQTLQSWTSPTLSPVINASGVILHTNLGRAPLSPAALQAVQAVALGYSNLEYDLERGQRGSRVVHAEALLQRLTGAPAALVVNNNAAAVLLALTALARRRSVVIARSQ